MFFKRKKTAEKAEKEQIPAHIAIIMDGNGRWAQGKSLPRTAGHAAGAETFRKIATYCKNIGVQYLTVYAFSTENWKRPQGEVDAIMGLLEKYLHEAIAQMERDKVRMKFFGDTSVLSDGLQALIAKTSEISKRFDGCQVNICVNYGGRDEIMRAAKSYGEAIARGEAAELCEADFEKHLFSADIPDPDLLIRPGGEMRLSNFLLWQTAYSELYFTEKLWPDFSTKDIDKAILEFNRRNRRFGGV